MGSTGRRKTTIINLLNRFYDINSGTILFDGEDITSFSLKSLRKNVASGASDVFLFADTVFQNITLGNPQYTLKDVELAAKQIGIHDFIMSLPGGYQYNVKERGIMLSSGKDN